MKRITMKIEKFKGIDMYILLKRELEKIGVNFIDEFTFEYNEDKNNEVMAIFDRLEPKNGRL